MPDPSPLRPTDPRPFAVAANQAWIDAVYAAAAPLVGFDVELESRDAHAVNPIRGRLLRVGKLTDRTPWSVAMCFGVGHLVLDEGDCPQSSRHVHPLNVTSIRALPSVGNALAVIGAADAA